MLYTEPFFLHLKTEVSFCLKSHNLPNLSVQLAKKESPGALKLPECAMKTILRMSRIKQNKNIQKYIFFYEMHKEKEKLSQNPQ